MFLSWGTSREAELYREDRYNLLKQLVYSSFAMDVNALQMQHGDRLILSPGKGTNELSFEPASPQDVCVTFGKQILDVTFLSAQVR